MTLSKGPQSFKRKHVDANFNFKIVIRTQLRDKILKGLLTDPTPLPILKMSAVKIQL
jgi:hypothetical protein